ATLCGSCSLVERQRHDLRGHRLLADLDGKYRTRLGIVGRTVAHADGLAERRRLGPAGDDAGPVLVIEHRVAVARDAPAGDDHADELLRGTLLRRSGERLAPDEVARLVELDPPAEPCLERIRLAIQLVAVERHARLEAERVARPEPAGDHPGVAASGGGRPPHR